MSTSISSRPLDLIYAIYLITHIPPTLLLDLQAIYPPQWVPQLMKDMLSNYVELFKDPFLGSPSTMYWFKSFVICQALFQVPFFIIGAILLIRGE